MIRVARERPRVAVATALCAIAVIAVSVGAGVLVAESSSTVPQSMEVRLASVESAARDQARTLATASAELRESRAAVQRLEKRVHEVGRVNARLREALRKAPEPDRRERRRRGPPASNKE
jgi:hypothetical protein